MFPISLFAVQSKTLGTVGQFILKFLTLLLSAEATTTIGALLIDLISFLRMKNSFILDMVLPGRTVWD